SASAARCSPASCGSASSRPRSANAALPELVCEHPAMQRYGMTIPVDGVALGEQRDWIVERADLGYTDVWSSEANGADAFTPLTLASVWAPGLRLGPGTLPGFTRGPAWPA